MGAASWRDYMAHPRHGPLPALLLVGGRLLRDVAAIQLVLVLAALTMTLNGIAADIGNRDWGVVVRRLLAVVSMLVGAVVGTLVVRQANARWGLLVVVGLLAFVTATSAVVSRRPAPWQSPTAG